MPLCHTCDGFFSHIQPPVDDSSHHTTISGLFAAAQAGCYICGRIINKLSHEQRECLQQLRLVVAGTDEPLTTITLMVMAAEGSWPDSIFVMVSVNRKHPLINSAATAKGFDQSSLGWLGSYAGTIVEFMPPSAFGEVEFGNPVSDTTQSEEAWGQAMKWLSKCQSTHRRCQERRGNELWHPTRLLDIGRDKEHLSSFWLIEGDKIDKSYQYVTLSHRWGDAKLLRLESSNHKDLMNGMPISVLPKTFQDAMMVARRLSIPYIWIDSLCIIQRGDHGADWRHEASMMYKVYNKAFCNISATWTNEPSHGIFFECNPSLLRPTEVCLRANDESVIEESFILSDAKLIWQSEMLDAPLNQRGWVLQERLLAPRILHFCRYELFWECCEVAASETYPHGIPLLNFDHNLKNLDPYSEMCRVEREKGKLSLDDRYLRHQLWWHILDDYSRCKLTVASDKLIAISGIARHMKEIIADQYIAGMWKMFLASELLWRRFTDNRYPRTDPRFNPSSRSDTPQAPSFTWAAVNCEFTPQKPDDQGVEVDVKCVHLQLDSGTINIPASISDVLNDIYELKPSHNLHLLVVGKLRSMKLVFDKTKNEWRFQIPSSTELQNSTTLPSSKQWAEIAKAHLDYDLDERETTNAQNQTFFYMPWKYGPKWFYCLLLEATNRDQGIFRRIGISFTNDEDRATQVQKEQGNEANLPCFNYSESSMRHTIFIC